MKIFHTEWYIETLEKEEKKIAYLDKKKFKELMNKTEVQALSQYYNRKVKIDDNKI